MHLSEYMATHHLDDAAVAAKVERSRATISRIRRRVARPDWDTIEALRLFSKGKITANDFVKLEDA